MSATWKLMPDVVGENFVMIMTETFINYWIIKVYAFLEHVF